jgi:hypothetical protein
MNKKGDIPFWLIITILILVSLLVVLALIFGIKGKLGEFLAWLGDVF